VATRDPFAFVALLELFDRIGPRFIEQAVAHDAAVNLRRDERLRGQVGETLDDFRVRKLGLATTAQAAASLKVPAKIAMRRRITRSGSDNSS
jgi:hypothetical protein